MRPVGAHERRDLYAVPAGVEAGGSLSLGADRVDAAIRAAPVRQFLDTLVDVLFKKIERLRARLAGQ